MDLMAPFPLTLLRIICGLWFLPHCWGKLSNIGPASLTFAKAGLKPPRAFVILTVILELVAAAGMIFGIYTRVAALLAVIVLCGAAFALVRINGFNWRWQKQGLEFVLFWAIACALSVAS